MELSTVYIMLRLVIEGPSSLSLPEIHWMKQRDNEVVPLADVGSDAFTVSLSANKTHKYL